jgi:hypothetical protein
MVLNQMYKLSKAKQRVNTIDRNDEEGMVQRRRTAYKDLRTTHIA